MITVVGFTGSQDGWSSHQKKVVRELLLEHEPYFVAHGACVGADDEFDKLAVELGFYRMVFPSNIMAKSIPPDTLRARSSKIQVYQYNSPLKRNRDIVDHSGRVIACPKQSHEILRSGTWATVRYARQRHIPVDIVYP